MEKNRNRRVDDPTLTRQSGLLSHPGTLLVVGMALLFTAYIFNVGGIQTMFDSNFDSFNKHAQGENDAVVGAVVKYSPLIAGSIILLIAYGILKKMGAGVKKYSKERKLSTRVSQSIHEFCDVAAENGIDHRVSRHAYRFLTPFYHDNVRSRMGDLLREDLHMTDAKVKDAMANMLHRCDRKKNFDVAPESVRTVLDLMMYVEKAPAHFLTHSAVRRARGHQAAPAPVLRTTAVGETKMVKPLHKRSGFMNAVKKVSGIRRAAPAKVEPREPVARPVNPSIAAANGREAKREIVVPRG